jgi:hypothetical protein
LNFLQRIFSKAGTGVTQIEGKAYKIQAFSVKQIEKVCYLCYTKYVKALQQADFIVKHGQIDNRPIAYQRNKNNFMMEY